MRGRVRGPALEKPDHRCRRLLRACRERPRCQPDGTGGTGSIVVQVRDSVVTGSDGNGIWAKRAGVVIDRTSSTDNAGYGVLADGSGAFIHLGNSTVVGNGGGLGTIGGGQILSYQNNQPNGNGFDGAPTGVLGLK